MTYYTANLLCKICNNCSNDADNDNVCLCEVEMNAEMEDE